MSLGFCFAANARSSYGIGLAAVGEINYLFRERKASAEFIDEIVSRNMMQVTGK